jgi:hypothetical protein
VADRRGQRAARARATGKRDRAGRASARARRQAGPSGQRDRARGSGSGPMDLGRTVEIGFGLIESAPSDLR